MSYCHTCKQHTCLSDAGRTVNRYVVTLLRKGKNLAYGLCYHIQSIGDAEIAAMKAFECDE